jgi:AAA+ superfamily predicted ATPase
MANPFRDLFMGTNARALVEAVVPHRTFADVVLPPETRRALEHALAQIHNHDLIFRRWGLGERHDAGLGLAFNFAGPPGTGKTICAEAIANSLGRRLLVVRYAELESQWAGATGKNVSAVFRSAAEQAAVLFFDEADAIASRRSVSMDQGYQREANLVVNVLLRELDEFPGVVVFATNLAANFDPAFERRIRNHILFTMPGPEERERIWRVQLHAEKTPLGDDVDFRALAEAYPASGGDIKNAVLKAAQMAASEPVRDDDKRIRQHHFEEGMRQVLAARSVMGQSLFGEGAPPDPWSALAGAAGADDEVRDEIGALSLRLAEVEDALAALPERLGRVEQGVGALPDRLGALEAAQGEATAALGARLAELEGAVQQVDEAARGRQRMALAAALMALVAAVGTLAVVLV